MPPSPSICRQGPVSSSAFNDLAQRASVTSTDASIGTWNRIDPQSFRRGVLNARRIEDCHKCLSHNGYLRHERSDALPKKFNSRPVAPTWEHQQLVVTAWFNYGSQSQQFLRSRFIGAPASAVSGTAWMRDSGAIDHRVPEATNGSVGSDRVFS